MEFDELGNPLGGLSAPATVAREAALRRANDLRQRDPAEAELQAIGEEADRVATYGANYKRDARGAPIQTGVGAPGYETVNHFSAIRRWEGEAAYTKALRKMWKENPDRARRIGLPEPERIGA